MIILLGGSGYIGTAFAGELRRRNWEFHALSRRDVDYTRYAPLAEAIRRLRPGIPDQLRRLYGKAERGRVRDREGGHFAGGTLFFPSPWPMLARRRV